MELIPLKAEFDPTFFKTVNRTFTVPQSSKCGNRYSADYRDGSKIIQEPVHLILMLGSCA